jgi:hypothetical protein
MQGLYNVPKSILDTFKYYTSENRTIERDIATTSGIIAGGIGLAVLAGVTMPIALPIAAVGLGVTALGISLMMNTEGKVQGNLSRNVSNNLVSMSCGEGGSEYDTKLKQTQITDPFYCVGNIGALGVSAYAIGKVQAKVAKKINQQINKNHLTSPSYHKNVEKGIIPDEDGSIQNKTKNSKDLVNPNAIKPLANILEDDLLSIQNSLNKGINKIDDIPNLSDHIKNLLKEYIDDGVDIFGCAQFSISSKNIYKSRFSIDDFFTIKANAQSPACGYKRVIEELAEYELKNVKLIKAGIFEDPSIELKYLDYETRYKKLGKNIRGRLDWKRVYDYFMYDGPTARGNRFNKSAKVGGWHEYDEVYLENGKFLDSYDPPRIDDVTKIVISGKIISRKAIDLDIIDEKSFKKYINEFKNKYQEDTVIKTKKDGYEKLFNQKLSGDYILEIPEVNQLSSNLENYVKIAKENNIKLEFRPEK